MKKFKFSVYLFKVKATYFSWTLSKPLPIPQSGWTSQLWTVCVEMWVNIKCNFTLNEKYSSLRQFSTRVSARKINKIHRHVFFTAFNWTNFQIVCRVIIQIHCNKSCFRIGNKIIDDLWLSKWRKLTFTLFMISMMSQVGLPSTGGVIESLCNVPSSRLIWSKWGKKKKCFVFL